MVFVIPVTTNHGEVTIIRTRAQNAKWPIGHQLSARVASSMGIDERTENRKVSSLDQLTANYPKNI